MALAAVSVAMFWSYVFLVLGSVLALFALAMIVMAAEWRRRVAVLSAISIVIGVVLSVDPDIGSYGNKHPAQEALASAVLLGVGAYVLLCLLRAHLAKHVPKDKGEAAESEDEKVWHHEPAGDGDVYGDGEVEAAERHDEGKDIFIAESREAPVQHAKEAPPEASQGR